MRHGSLDVGRIRNLRLARESLKERTGQGAIQYTAHAARQRIC
jgi:hypothetical protein